MYGDTEQKGKKSIARSDTARGSYYRSVSGHKWGDARQYELNVNSSIGMEKTAELICAYISLDGPSLRAKGKEGGKENSKDLGKLSNRPCLGDRPLRVQLKANAPHRFNVVLAGDVPQLFPQIAHMDFQGAFCAVGGYRR